MTPLDTKNQPGVCAALLAVIMTLLALAVMVSGCTRTTYVPVESVRTEWRDRDVERVVTDTVHDTRVVWVKGDTIVDMREREHIRSVEVHDTCYMLRTDSVAVPYPVERRLTRWEQAKQDAGGVAISAIAIVFCVAVAWLIRKFRK